MDAAFCQSGPRAVCVGACTSSGALSGAEGVQFVPRPRRRAAHPQNAPRLRVRDDEPWISFMEAATPPLDKTTAAAAPTRLPLRRRVLRRAAWLTVDVAATGVCAVLFLKALT
jgi:hypothetical protein